MHIGNVSIITSAAVPYQGNYFVELRQAATVQVLASVSILFIPVLYHSWNLREDRSALTHLHLPQGRSCESSHGEAMQKGHVSGLVNGSRLHMTSSVSVYLGINHNTRRVAI